MELIIPLGIAALAVLLSYQMPVYMARVIGQEAALNHLWMAAWYDSISSRVLFITAYMLAGFLSWAGPVTYIVVALFDPRYGPALRRRTVRALVFLTIPLTPVLLFLQRKRQQWSDEIEARRRLRALYETDFKEEFLSFSEFESYYRRLNDAQQIDRQLPVGKALAAALDEFEDAEILLGLEKGYAMKDLTARYRALMKHVHPDIAGPNDIARRVGAARDIVSVRKGWK